MYGSVGLFRPEGCSHPAQRNCVEVSEQLMGTPTQRRCYILSAPDSLMGTCDFLAAPTNAEKASWFLHWDADDWFYLPPTHRQDEAALGAFVPHPGLDPSSAARTTTDISGSLRIQVKTAIDAAIDELNAEKAPLRPV